MSDAVFRLIEILMWGGWGYMLCKVFRINNEINVVEYSKKRCEKQAFANKSVIKHGVSLCSFAQIIEEHGQIINVIITGRLAPTINLVLES